MLDLLLDNKWLFLIGAEVSFWVLSAAFLLLRYWLGLDRGSFVLLTLVVLDNLFILALGILDYLRTGEFAAYQIVIAAVLAYVLTVGRGDMRRLDAYLKERAARWTGQPSPPETPRRQDVQDKAKRYRRSWYEHLIVFVVGQVVFLTIGDSWVPLVLASEGPTEEPSGLTTASWVWTIVFVIDTVWSLSYTIFPSRGTRR